MKFLLLLLFVITGNISMAQNLEINFYGHPTNPSHSIKKAGISKEFIYTYLIKKNKITDSAVIAIVTYDTSALILSYENFLMPNDEKSKSIFYYNDSNYIIKILTSYSKRTPTTREFFYDSLGREIFRSSYSKQHSILEWKEYDETGRLIKIHSKINSGKKYVSRKYYYKNDGELLRIEGFDLNGRLDFTEYDEYSANKLEKKSYLKNGPQAMLRSISYYNEQDQLIKKTSYSEIVTEFSEHFYQYNPDGTVAEWVITSNGTLQQVRRHYYYFFD